MTSYFTISDTKKGQIKISSDSFIKLASDGITELITDKYKGMIYNFLDNKKAVYTVKFLKTKVIVNCCIFLGETSDVKNLLSDVKEYVYNKIHSCLDVNLQVDISFLNA